MTWWLHPDEAERQDEARASEDERRQEEAIADVLREFELDPFTKYYDTDAMAAEIVALREALAATEMHRAAPVVPVVTEAERVEELWSKFVMTVASIADTDLTSTFSTIQQKAFTKVMIRALAAAPRVTDAMRLALDVLTWQMEARSRCGDPDAECPLQDACKPSHDHTLAIAALTAALEGPRDQ